MTDQKTVKRRVGRYFVALAIGGFAALSLLWVMQFLIATGQAAITEALDARFVDFVRVKREETVERKQEKPERPPEVDEQPPELPQQNMDSSDFDSSVAVSVPSPDMNVGLDGELGDFSLAEGDYLPIVKVAPMYPRRAQSRGLEGHCDLQFTVTAAGHYGGRERYRMHQFPVRAGVGAGAAQVQVQASGSEWHRHRSARSAAQDYVPD